MIQFWTTDPAPIEAALRAAGIDAAITRVDFEAALNAALAHERFDVAIYDPSTPGMSRESVEACLKLYGRGIPLLVVDDPSTLGARLLCIMNPRRN